jgi:lipopolysaccharide export system protein LptC
MRHLAVVREAEPRRAPAAARPRSTAAAFRAAIRHSRRVRFLRIAVPVFVLLTVAGIFGAAWVDSLRLFGRLPLEMGQIVVSGSKITMEQPRLAGFTRDARPYELTARSAAHDITAPELVQLRDLRAKLEMRDNTVVEISANAGLFNTKAERLTLEDNIFVTSSSGYEGRLSHAVVDTRSGNIVSERPVWIKMLNGTIQANAMEIEQAGELVRFREGVTMQLMPNREPGAAGGPQP